MFHHGQAGGDWTQENLVFSLQGFAIGVNSPISLSLFSFKNERKKEKIYQSDACMQAAAVLYHSSVPFSPFFFYINIELKRIPKENIFFYELNDEREKEEKSRSMESTRKPEHRNQNKSITDEKGKTCL